MTWTSTAAWTWTWRPLSSILTYRTPALPPPHTHLLYRPHVPRPRAVLPQALIGYFDLDPNRCLDLVLEAAEQQPANRAYLRLIPLFKRDAVVHLLGFRFQQYQVPQLLGGVCSGTHFLAVYTGMPLLGLELV